ncbi:MAG: hypothetical protein HQK49_19040 [Oligoflexia bacterium]|nr:hypothetical protein [Oligoflexia bacterium]
MFFNKFIIMLIIILTMTANSALFSSEDKGQENNFWNNLSKKLDRTLDVISNKTTATIDTIGKKVEQMIEEENFNKGRVFKDNDEEKVLYITRTKESRDLYGQFPKDNILTDFPVTEFSIEDNKYSGTYEYDKNLSIDKWPNQIMVDVNRMSILISLDGKERGHICVDTTKEPEKVAELTLAMVSELFIQNNPQLNIDKKRLKDMISTLIASRCQTYDADSWKMIHNQLHEKYDDTKNKKMKKLIYFISDGDNFVEFNIVGDRIDAISRGNYTMRGDKGEVKREIPKVIGSVYVERIISVYPSKGNGQISAEKFKMLKRHIEFEGAFSNKDTYEQKVCKFKKEESMDAKKIKKGEKVKEFLGGIFANIYNGINDNSDKSTDQKCNGSID